MGRGPVWTDEEVELLRANNFLSNKDLAEKLGRTVDSVRNAKLKYRAAHRVVTAWTDYDRRLLADNPLMPETLLAEKLGRSVQSVRNERMKQRREAGIAPRESVVPHQELHDRPPGTYVEIIGRLLIEDDDCMAAWMHAHGYSTFEIKWEDSLGWTTVVCTKEK